VRDDLLMTTSAERPVPDLELQAARAAAAGFADSATPGVGRLLAAVAATKPPVS